MLSRPSSYTPAGVADSPIVDDFNVVLIFVIFLQPTLGEIGKKIK
jgi:hypothetical protein